MTDQGTPQRQYFKDADGVVWINHPALGWHVYQDGAFNPSEFPPLNPVPFTPAPPATAPSPAKAPTQPPPQIYRRPSDTKKAPVDVTIAHAAYVGGMPGQRGPVNGNLIVRNGRIGIGIARTPKVAVVRLVQGTSLRIESATVAKSRAGKAIMFGVLAAAARSQQSAAFLTIDLANGAAATYEVKGMTAPELAARLRVPLATYGVRI